MDIAILLYDRMTALDAIGPAQVLAGLGGARLWWVAADPGPKLTDCGVALTAHEALGDVPSPDVVLIPGGVDVRPVMADARVLDWIRVAHATSTWTTSVCTGALILGAAGVLRGLRATTHWLMLAELTKAGAEPVQRRVVRDGKVITAAGVSAGIDMALHLASLVAGENVAKAIQLALEYDPEPPFACGSAAKASPEIQSLARRALTRPGTR